MRKCGARAARSSGSVWFPSAAPTLRPHRSRPATSSRSTRAGSSKRESAGMSLGLAFVAVLAVAFAAAWVGFARGRRLRTAGRLHSLPVYHGAYAALWAAIPALLLLAAWAPIQSRMVDQAVLSSPEGRALPAFEMQRQSILSEAREIASGEREQGFNPQSSTLAPRIRDAQSRYAVMGGAVALLVAMIAAGLALRRSAPQFRARTGVERWLMIVLLAASLIAILTTLGIQLSLMFESLRFFKL